MTNLQRRREQIAKLRAAGKTVEQIAEITGVSLHQINKDITALEQLA